MTKFVSNVNAYLSEMKIKQTYLSMISGIDKNKLSRILTGAQEENGSDMRNDMMRRVCRCGSFYRIL